MCVSSSSVKRVCEMKGRFFFFSLRLSLSLTSFVRSLCVWCVRVCDGVIMDDGDGR